MVINPNIQANHSPPSVTTGATTGKLRALSKPQLDIVTVNTARGRIKYKRSRLKVARYGF